jgi:hypothetical protein
MLTNSVISTTESLCVLICLDLPLLTFIYSPVSTIRWWAPWSQRSCFIPYLLFLHCKPAFIICGTSKNYCTSGKGNTMNQTAEAWRCVQWTGMRILRWRPPWGTRLESWWMTLKSWLPVLDVWTLFVDSERRWGTSGRWHVECVFRKLTFSISVWNEMEGEKELEKLEKCWLEQKEGSNCVECLLLLFLEAIHFNVCVLEDILRKM